MNQIEKATESVSMNSIEQTAYFRAVGDKNNLDMNKYRQQVVDELKARKNPAEKGIIRLCFNNISFLDVKTDI